MGKILSVWTLQKALQCPMLVKMWNYYHVAEIIKNPNFSLEKYVRQKYSVSAVERCLRVKALAALPEDPV